MECMMTRTTWLRLALVAMVGAVGGCTDGGGDGGPDTEACGVVGLNPKIINGTACENRTSPVVYIALERRDGQFSCTGTMLTPTSVLTAAHCMGGGVRRAQVAGGNDFDQSASVVQIFVHPNAAADNASTRIRNDVAIMKLDRPLNIPTLPIIASRAVEAGDIISILGYGLTEEKQTGELRSGEMEVTANEGDSIVAIFGDEGSNTCFGDSGGPAIYSDDGLTGVVGVTSGGSRAECDEGDISTFANTGESDNLDFITRTVPDAQVR